ncbi:hypothetical protein PMAYCL1PPCAC_18579, partial [Pristionchus mayeri]
MDNASVKKPLLSSNSSRGIHSIPLQSSFQSFFSSLNCGSEMSVVDGSISASGEGSSKESKKDSKKDTKTESNEEIKKDSKKESKESTKDSQKSKKENAPVSGGGKGAPSRIVRPTVQARPFSTKTKGVYWIFTVLHLIALLSLLFAISYSLLLFVFAQTSDGPLYWGLGSFIGGVPAVMHEPVVVTKENPKAEIKFNPNDYDSYKNYVGRLRTVTKRNNEKEITIDKCSAHKEFLSEKANDNGRYTGIKTDTHCIQTFLNKDPSCDPHEVNNDDMGYRNGAPCLLIRLTKLRGFFPSSGDKNTDKENTERNRTTCGGMLTFECTAKHGDNSILMSNLDGISYCHFPFWNQEGYEAPYVMIRPIEPLPVGKTVINCVPNLKTLDKLSSGLKNEVKFTVEILEKKLGNGTTTTPTETTNKVASVEVTTTSTVK